ncbi:MAG: ABC transporter permease [SAR202 cluster bacterium]|jgi:peptide/nickel transport system permease protein|nr:ABC transporter permease [SAR202 cluster bacterium]
MIDQTANQAMESLLRPRKLGVLGDAWAFVRRWPLIPGIVLVVLVITGIFAPLIAPHDPIKQEIELRNAPPFWYPEGSAHRLLGADHVGRDVLSRVVHGARISLLVASISLSTGVFIGTTLGLIAGYVGGMVDELIMRAVDVSLSLPFVLIALVSVIIFGASLGLVIGLLALFTWASFVRYVRAEVLTLKERDYVALAKVAGASTSRILIRHILPGVMNTVIVVSTLRVGQLILTEATLSFIGAGIPAPTPAWGLLISEGRSYVTTAWWTAFFPGLAIFLVVMSLNFMGDWIRDRLDPRLRQL